MTPDNWTSGYIDFNGHETFRKATAKMMENTWVKAPVNAKYLAVQSGAGSILDSLSWCLCESGDAFITPGPAYPAFPNDFFSRSGVTMQIANTDSSKNHEVQMMDLDAAFSEAAGDLQKDVKILLLCNPCNPTGRIYERETLDMVVDWCEVHKIHLICDEIYANSTFPGQ